MQIKLRDVPLGKPSVNESKNIMISWTWVFSMTRQISTLVVTSTDRTWVFGLSSWASVCAHLVWKRERLFAARWVVVALSGHTGSRMLKKSGDCEHRAIYWIKEKKIHSGTEAKAGSRHGYCDLSTG